jgi:hypothetical protein
MKPLSPRHGRDAHHEFMNMNPSKIPPVNPSRLLWWSSGLVATLLVWILAGCSGGRSDQEAALACKMNCNVLTLPAREYQMEHGRWPQNWDDIKDAEPGWTKSEWQKLLKCPSDPRKATKGDVSGTNLVSYEFLTGQLPRDVLANALVVNRIKGMNLTNIIVRCLYHDHVIAICEGGVPVAFCLGCDPSCSEVEEQRRRLTK